MKLGIDSYTFHRYFGETYAGLEADPDERMSVWDFLDEASTLGAEGVSLESCFLPVGDSALTAALAARLDELHMERIWAWGHPRGFNSGRDAGALESARASLQDASRVGARVMRICAGGRGTRPASWEDHKAALLPQLVSLVADARRVAVILALENHIDLLADEMLDLIETIGSEHLGVCLDTANNLRMFENPKCVIAKLAPYTRAVHAKDIIAVGGDPNTMAFWPSVRLGQGLIDMRYAVDELALAGFNGLLAIELDYIAPGYGEEHAGLKASIRHLDALRQQAHASRAPDGRAHYGSARMIERSVQR